ncbi:uncharacterized protein B0I36DRAFT_362759 [Microdochium trichocladiopsis]|uniref:RING-type domain-containing protein n=1 Tax=Microdochium trichocladiopsis TaxID=1682393 RepID=A0A9P8Y604_9PEZI|nr:uncharacterized protein B0I36DRAFT_362759 [Microdochium trichocladiopsis]KAH7030971.1 hypothetical protein B0I36DRAFT_362759 [Microdochium trichocladiopsis]
MSFFQDRYSGMYLPSIGGFETSPRSRSRPLSGGSSDPSAHLNPIFTSMETGERTPASNRTPPLNPSSPPSSRNLARARSNGTGGSFETGLGSGSPPSSLDPDSGLSGSPRSAMPPRTWYPPTSAYSAARARHAQSRLNADLSEPSSEEEADLDPFESDVNALLMLESMPNLHASEEERIRAQQIMRGALSSRRVASGKALAALERVNIPDLPDNERTCVICYNDYGVQTPEGISEVPLRLPKCKHIFGDHCIKKWFEENDTCPYCRDKVPSQPQFHYGNRQNMTQFLRAQHLRARNPLQDTAGGSLQALLRYRPGAPAGDSFLGPSDSFVRRADNYRSSAWNSRPRSPPTDVYESRRRTRARHGGLRGSPPIGRPSSYSAGLVNIAPHATQQSHASNRLHFHGQSHRHQGSLPTLNHTLSGPGVEHAPYLLEHLLRPVTASTTDYSPPVTTMGMPSTLRDGSAPRTGPLHSSTASVTPLSPTISGPEMSMNGQN